MNEPVMTFTSTAYLPESVAWTGTDATVYTSEVDCRVSDELRAMGRESLRQDDEGLTEEWPK